MCKRAFGMKVIGAKKHPEMVTKEQAQWADEIIGIDDKYEKYLGEADYVVAVLPRLPSTDNFFTDASCFSKMKKTGIFMNIGRGTVVNEDELAAALTSGKIGGAALDVYKVEPLSKDSKLWAAPNCLMTPHCADQDADWLVRSM